MNGGKTFTYDYDRNGNRISADDGNIRYEYEYDRTDLLDKVDRFKQGEAKVSFEYFYDDLGNLINATESINDVERSEIVYEYNDPRYLNTKITQSGNGLAAKEVRFTYNAAGLNTQIDRY